MGNDTSKLKTFAIGILTAFLVTLSFAEATNGVTSLASAVSIAYLLVRAVTHKDGSYYSKVLFQDSAIGVAAAVLFGWVLLIIDLVIVVSVTIYKGCARVWSEIKMIRDGLGWLYSEIERSLIG